MLQLTMKISGAAAVVVGLLGICFGSFWASRTMTLFDSYAVGRALDTFIPFLPVFLITFGAFLLVKTRQ